jgi:WbqC-like protein family
MMQPTFLPWQGYFGLMFEVDVFVFLDDFQYAHRSWQQRNRLFEGPDVVGWVTVPVDRHQGEAQRPSLLEAKPLWSEFSRKLEAQLRRVYGKAPAFAEVMPVLEPWLGASWGSVAELNIALIDALARRFEVPCRFLRSSALPHQGKRSTAIHELLVGAGARAYLSARGSAEYMRDDGVFPVAGIDTFFEAFAPQPYPQLHATSFVAQLSVIDALMNVGFPATAALIRAGCQPPQSWADRWTGTPPAR